MTDLDDFPIKKKMPWGERVKIIRSRYPSVERMDWRKALNDEDIFARIVRDLLKVDQAVPGRVGPRPALDQHQGMESLKRLMGQDFCTLEFPQALRLLAGSMSLTQLARKTALSRSHVNRLLHAEAEPDLFVMQTVADAFGKHPSFFSEYRAAYVLAHLESRLMQAPESTIGFYRKISQGV